MKNGLAAGARVDHVCQAGDTRIGPEQASEELVHRLGAQRRQRQLLVVGPVDPLGFELRAEVDDEDEARAGDGIHPLLQPRGAGAVDPVQVLDQRDGVLGPVLHQLAQHAEELALLNLWIDVRHRTFRVGHAEELEQDRQNLAIAVVQQEQMAGELLTRAAVRVVFGDAVVVTKDLQDRQ